MNKIKNFFNGKLSNYFEIIQQDFIMSSSIFRLNYYCAMVRELFRLFFEQNNNDVLICSWYKEEDENGKKSKPRRADLIRYYLCGGISDEICVEYDFLDSIHKAQKKYKDVLEEIQKYTHLSSLSPSKEMDEKHFEIINNFIEDMLDALEIIKGGLSEKIESHLFEEISSYFSEIPSEIDCLSTHSLPKDCEIESINIESIDSKEIIVNGEGTIDIRLQYGSNGDVARGDGDVYCEKLPFTFVFNFNVSNLSDYKLIKCSVDAENYYR